MKLKKIQFNLISSPDKSNLDEPARLSFPELMCIWVGCKEALVGPEEAYRTKAPERISGNN